MGFVGTFFPRYLAFPLIPEKCLDPEYTENFLRSGAPWSRFSVGGPPPPGLAMICFFCFFGQALVPQSVQASMLFFCFPFALPPPPLFGTAFVEVDSEDLSIRRADAFGEYPRPLLPLSPPSDIRYLRMVGFPRELPRLLILADCLSRDRHLPLRTPLPTQDDEYRFPSCRRAIDSISPCSFPPPLGISRRALFREN